MDYREEHNTWDLRAVHLWSAVLEHQGGLGLGCWPWITSTLTLSTITIMWSIQIVTYVREGGEQYRSLLEYIKRVEVEVEVEVVETYTVNTWDLTGNQIMERSLQEVSKFYEKIGGHLQKTATDGSLVLFCAVMCNGREEDPGEPSLHPGQCPPSPTQHSHHVEDSVQRFLSMYCCNNTSKKAKPLL